jgi:hypothetical protein
LVPLLCWAVALQAGEGPGEKLPAVPSGPGGGDEAGAFDLFPVGKPWKQVRVPRYNAKDELTSIMHAETLTREAERLLQLEGLTLAMFEPDRSLALRLKTAKGTYELANGELRTRTKTYIEHPRFDMQGDGMVFDTRSGKGKLNGNVEMIVYAMDLPAGLGAVPSSR